MKKFVLILLLLMTKASAFAQRTSVPIGYYYSTNSFSGEAILIKPNHRFETQEWSDVDFSGFYPPDPESVKMGERGKFKISGDTLWLMFNDVIMDSTKVKKMYGDTLVWSQSPKKWAKKYIDKLNAKNRFYHIRKIGNVTVLVRPGDLEQYEKCQEAYSDKPNSLFVANDPKGCEGILRPKRK